MPRKNEMTYVPSLKTWKKMKDGKMYRVSTIALGTEPTKEASWQAANAWWMAKENEIKGIAPIGSLERVAAMCSQFAGKIPEPRELPQIYANMVETALGANAETQSLFFYELLGKDRYERLQGVANESKRLDTIVADTLADNPILDQTMQSNIKAWVEFLQVKVNNGTLSASSFDGYRREIRHFETFTGKFAPISAINNDTLKGYYLEISKGTQAPAGKKLRFDVAKMFIRNLCEDGKIATPSKLSSKDFRWEQSEAKKDTWTIEEFQAQYKARKGLERLTLLLAANCGIYGSDIADVPGNVDYKQGTLTKKRVKTGVKTTWILWPETLKLLQAHENELAALYRKDIVDGKLKKVFAPCLRGLKQLRHTSISFLGNSSLSGQSAYFAQHAAGVTDQHYNRTFLKTCQEIADLLFSKYFPK